MDAFFCCSFFPFIRDSHTSANSNTEKQKKEEARFEKYPSLCFKIVSLALRSWLTSSSLEVRKVHQRDRSMAFTFFPFPFSITALAVGVCPTDIAWHQFTTGKYMLPLSFFFFCSLSDVDLEAQAQSCWATPSCTVQERKATKRLVLRIDFSCSYA